MSRRRSVTGAVAATEQVNLQHAVADFEDARDCSAAIRRDFISEKRMHVQHEPAHATAVGRVGPAKMLTGPIAGPQKTSGCATPSKAL
jgi:hypothetical protein